MLEIDGVLQPGEWIDAQIESMGNPYAPSPVQLYLKYAFDSGQAWLCLAVDDPNDEILDPGNGLGILFDLDGSSIWDAAESILRPPFNYLKHMNLKRSR
jgi:hypothetical protein